MLCRRRKEDPFVARDLAALSAIETHLANLYANLLAGPSRAGTGYASAVVDAALAASEQAAASTDTADLFELSKLTTREREIAFLMCQGNRTDLIATSLSMSPLTVKKHISNILRKTGVATRHELTTTLLRQFLSTM